MAARRALCIKTAADLGPLLRSFRRYDAIHIVSDAIAEDRDLWEQRLLSAYSDCGCTVGGAALVLTLGAWAVISLVSHETWTWRSAWLVIGACVAAALVGKAAGIAFARIGLRRDVRRLTLILAGPASRVTVRG
ncbi:MAG: hypothetical protein HY047_20565 [Acidobacteria bacterium]|nr:hypothetical protein [Acidobacteriota bacterium]